MIIINNNTVNLKKLLATSATALTLAGVAMPQATSVSATSGTGEEVVVPSAINVTRYGGKDRIETSIKLSEAMYKSSDNVTIAGFHGEVDALSGTVLASHLDAPMLMINKDKVREDVSNELERLDVKNVYILGGFSVVSKEVQTELEKTYNVIRVSGTDRVETAVKAMEQSNLNELEESKDVEEVFLALGYNHLADPLAVGPASAKHGIPTLLTQSDKLSEKTLKAIVDNNVKKVTIIGGLTAVSQEVEDSLPEGVVVNRISGSNRTETALKVAQEYFEETTGTVLANGYASADAVISGYAAAKLDFPINLVENKGHLSDKVESYIKDNLTDVVIVGGNSVVSEDIDTMFDEKVDVEEDTDTDTDIDGEIDAEDNTISPEEEEALDAITERTIFSKENNIFIPVAKNDDFIEYEIRAKGADEENVTSIIGYYRYTLDSKKVFVKDPNTGEYLEYGVFG